MKKFLLVATVVKLHVNFFHLPVLKMMKEKGYEVHVASHNDYDNPSDMHIPYCDKFIEIPFERSPMRLNNVNAYRILKELFEEENSM